MKRILFLLALLPFAACAQTNSQPDPLQQKDDGNLQLMQAAKKFTQPAVRKDNSPKKLKDDEVYMGNVQFKIGNNEIDCDSAIQYTNENTMAMFHVKLTNPQYFDVVGDEMHYNKDDNTATLINDITVTAKNGNVVGTSNTFKLDFSYDIFRIMEGAITPPRNK